MSELPLSTHRLPVFYRYSLTLLWVAIPALLVVAMLFSGGMRLAMFDPRLLLPLLLMLIPAMHIWQQGVDVYREGLRVRVYLPCYHPYETLAEWQLYPSPQGRILTIVNQERAAVLRYHAAHLTDLPLLVQALGRHLPKPPAF